MVFASLIFVFTFFVLYMWLYLIAPSVRSKNVVLLIFSIIFYAWGEPVYILLLLGSVGANYLFARKIETESESGSEQRSKVFLILAIIFNVALLGVFKYADFLIININSIFGASLPLPNIPLPLGISFYTFQIMSYVIDVYRKDVPAQKAYWKLLLYISSFHQLVAGPIVRYKDVADEIEDRAVNLDEITAGMNRFLVGLVKKALLANTAGALSSVYMDSEQLESIPALGAWFGLILFSAQIYLDFSAYSDMAIGLGWISGFHYKENFNYPYMSGSVTEFWRRWHISLGTFFRDYVYIPLGGNRKHQTLNIMTVWLLTGLWHGASWNFVLWGLYFSVLLIIEKFVLLRILEKIPRFFGHIYLLITVMFSWILFYYSDFSKIPVFIKSLFGLNGNSLSSSQFEIHFLNNIVLFAVIVISMFPVSQIIKSRFEEFSARSVRNNKISTVLILINCFVMITISALSLVGDSYNPFLYFRF